MDYSKTLSNKLKKLLRKNPFLYSIIMKKISKIKSDTPVHLGRYKNLSYELSEFKRVHIDSHFVLIFKVTDTIIKFVDFDHHDNIYSKI